MLFGASSESARASCVAAVEFKVPLLDAVLDASLPVDDAAVVAIVPSCGKPLDVVLGRPSMQLVILGKAGVRVRDWGVMRALPPPDDFAQTAMIDERLADAQLRRFPYLLWMSFIEAGTAVRTISGGARLLHERNIDLMHTVFKHAPGAIAAAPLLLHVKMAPARGRRAAGSKILLDVHARRAHRDLQRRCSPCSCTRTASRRCSRTIAWSSRPRATRSVAAT